MSTFYSLSLKFQLEWARINKTVESHKSAHPSMPPPPPPATPAVKAAKDRGPVSDNGLAKQVPDRKSTPTTSARPTIKLKIGGGTHGNGPVNGASAKTPSK